MSFPHQLNHDANSYLAITFAPSSSYNSSPTALAGLFPGLRYQGKVGQLDDVHLYSMDKRDWLDAKDTVLAGLGSHDDVIYVEEQIPRQRVRKGGDEL